MKRCSKCLEEKPYEGFYKRKGGLAGLHAQCKECFCLASKATPERKKQIDKEYYQKNKEKRKLLNQAWKNKNPSYFQDYHRRKNQEKRVDYGADSQGAGFDSGSQDASLL